MFEITPTENLRAASLRIRLRFQDLVPVEGKKWWQLPYESLKDLPVEIREVVRLFFEGEVRQEI